jgi:hypothetical protein
VKHAHAPETHGAQEGGVGPIQRYGSEAVAGAWHLARQDVRIEKAIDAGFVIGFTRRHLLDGEAAALVPVS